MSNNNDAEFNNLFYASSINSYSNQLRLFFFYSFNRQFLHLLSEQHGEDDISLPNIRKTLIDKLTKLEVIVRLTIKMISEGSSDSRIKELWDLINVTYQDIENAFSTVYDSTEETIRLKRELKSLTDANIILQRENQKNNEDLQQLAAEYSKIEEEHKEKIKNLKQEIENQNAETQKLTRTNKNETKNLKAEIKRLKATITKQEAQIHNLEQDRDLKDTEVIRLKKLLTEKDNNTSPAQHHQHIIPLELKKEIASIASEQIRLYRDIKDKVLDTDCTRIQEFSNSYGNRLSGENNKILLNIAKLKCEKTDSYVREILNIIAQGEDKDDLDQISDLQDYISNYDNADNDQLALINMNTLSLVINTVFDSYTQLCYESGKLTEFIEEVTKQLDGN